MKKRMIIMLTSMAAFVAVIGFVKFTQIKTAIAQGKAWQPPPEAVTTIVAAKEEWASTRRAIGTVAAVRGVTVSADLPGMVQKIDFESGRAVKEGEVLVELDTSQERAQLDAAKAQRDLTRLTLDRMNELKTKGVTSQSEVDQAQAAFQEAAARVDEIQATILRKTIRAPFSGVLGIRQVNLGQYLTGGDPVVPLQALDPIFVNFAVPQQDVGDLAVGAKVVVTADGALGDGTVAGRITAVNSVVDSDTRNVQVQATFDNPDGKLRPGMFVEVRVVLGPPETYVALPASAISYAPYGDSVFIVGDMKGKDGKSYRGVRQQFVKVGESRGDQVAVLDGVSPGDEVVTSGVFKLRTGAAVIVNNDVQPGNSPSPRPEDS